MPSSIYEHARQLLLEFLKAGGARYPSRPNVVDGIGLFLRTSLRNLPETNFWAADSRQGLQELMYDYVDARTVAARCLHVFLDGPFDIFLYYPSVFGGVPPLVELERALEKLIKHPRSSTVALRQHVEQALQEVTVLHTEMRIIGQRSNEARRLTSMQEGLLDLQAVLTDFSNGHYAVLPVYAGLVLPNPAGQALKFAHLLIGEQDDNNLYG